MSYPQTMARDTYTERLGKTLEQLEGSTHPATAGATTLVQRCQALRKKPLGQMTAEDLRIQLGQRLELSYLLPVALALLEREPLAAGDYYRGDLLGTVLRIEPEFWRRNVELHKRVLAIVDALPERPEEIADELAEFARELA